MVYIFASEIINKIEICHMKCFSIVTGERLSVDKHCFNIYSFSLDGKEVPISTVIIDAKKLFSVFKRVNFTSGSYIFSKNVFKIGTNEYNIFLPVKLATLDILNDFSENKYYILKCESSPK